MLGSTRNICPSFQKHSPSHLKHFLSSKANFEAYLCFWLPHSAKTEALQRHLLSTRLQKSERTRPVTLWEHCAASLILLKGMGATLEYATGKMLLTLTFINPCAVDHSWCYHFIRFSIAENTLQLMAKTPVGKKERKWHGTSYCFMLKFLSTQSTKSWWLPACWVVCRAVEMQWTGYSRDHHVVMRAVNLSTRVSRCDCQRPRHVNEVHQDSQVRHSDHYTVLSSHSAVAFSNSLKDKQRMLKEVYLARHCWNTAYSPCKWLCSIHQIKWQDSLHSFRKAAHLIRNPWVQL